MIGFVAVTIISFFNTLFHFNITNNYGMVSIDNSSKVCSCTSFDYDRFESLWC